MPSKKDLIDFINEASPEKLQVEEDLGFGYVRLNVTEAQRRQAKDDINQVEDVLVELLRNSRDANASQIYIASWKEGSNRNLAVIDNGDGIPDKLQQLIFEPRVTSKLNRYNQDNYGFHGRGMALYSISCNCAEAKVCFSQANKITAIKVCADTIQLPEKANQSTWPVFDAKGFIKEGPLNIIRRSIEFNLSHQKIEIFLGTPAEIISTLKENSLIDYKSASQIQRLAAKFGLDISLRNCQRIFYNQIRKLDGLLNQAKFANKPAAKKLNKTSILLNQTEMQEILSSIKHMVDSKAEEYFLKVSDDAKITKLGNTLKIVLPLEFKD